MIYPPYNTITCSVSGFLPSTVCWIQEWLPQFQVSLNPHLTIDSIHISTINPIVGLFLSNTPPPLTYQTPPNQLQGLTSGIQQDFPINPPTTSWKPSRLLPVAGVPTLSPLVLMTWMGGSPSSWMICGRKSWNILWQMEVYNGQIPSKWMICDRENHWDRTIRVYHTLEPLPNLGRTSFRQNPLPDLFFLVHLKSLERIASLKDLGWSWQFFLGQYTLW